MRGELAGGEEARRAAGCVGRPSRSQGSLLECRGGAACAGRAGSGAGDGGWGFLGRQGRARQPDGAWVGLAWRLSPHFRERLGVEAVAFLQRCQPAPACGAGERTARPKPHFRAAPASLGGHGGVCAASARSYHGSAGLRQGHRVLAHHQTLRAEAPLQRGPAPRQYASGHRWEPGREGWLCAVVPVGICGRRDRGSGSGSQECGSRGAGAASPNCRPGGGGGEVLELLRYCSPKPLASVDSFRWFIEGRH